MCPLTLMTISSPLLWLVHKSAGAINPRYANQLINQLAASSSFNIPTRTVLSTGPKVPVHYAHLRSVRHVGEPPVGFCRFVCWPRQFVWCWRCGLPAPTISHQPAFVTVRDSPCLPPTGTICQYCARLRLTVLEKIRGLKKGGARSKHGCILPSVKTRDNHHIYQCEDNMRTPRDVRVIIICNPA
jgi:hypothetical protein